MHGPFSADAAYDVTPLHIAALYGQKNSIATLIDVGADVTSRDKYGMTPMHSAASNGQVKLHVNRFYDVAVRQPGAFSIVTDLT